MTNEPTPETDAKLASDPHPPSDWPEYARALEIQRNAARAERDKWHAFAEERDQCPNCEERDQLRTALVTARAERDEARNALTGNLWTEWETERAATLGRLAAAQQTVERFTAALDLIATPMRIDGTYTIGRDECGYIARKALATPAQ